MKSILIITAAGLMLSSLQAQAGPGRVELLAGHGHESNRGQEYRQARPHHPSRHRGVEYRQHHYDNARRYAAGAVRQARQAHQLGYYSDHPRWSLNFQRHFEWALRADAWKIEREARKRSQKLRELRHAGYGYGYPN